eukprot:g13255.t1
MGALVRRKSFDHVTVAFFVIYLAGLCARKFYQLVFMKGPVMVSLSGTTAGDPPEEAPQEITTPLAHLPLGPTILLDEANMASDWTTNFMRRYAFQGVGAIFVLIGVIVLLDLIGFVTGDSSPWEGMQEYTMGLMFMSAVYSLYMWKLESIDSAFCVAMLVFTLGLVFGLPFKLLVHLFGIYGGTSWPVAKSCNGKDWDCDWQWHPPGNLSRADNNKSPVCDPKAPERTRYSRWG